MKNYDLIVIGAGPGGVQTAQSADSFGLKVLIIDKNSRAGGLQINNPYVNHWLATSYNMRGEDFVEAMNKNLVRPKTDFFTSAQDVTLQKRGELFEINGLSDQGRFSGRAQFLTLATGVKPASGGLTESENIYIGPGYRIENADFRDKKIAILGGGDNGFENYAFIREKKARTVKIFARSIRARHNMVQNVPTDDVTLGDYAVNTENMTVNGEKFDALCIFYGWKPVVPFQDSLRLRLNEKGFVLANEYCETSVKNIFAVGEMTGRVHPSVVTAMSDGMIAAKAIQERADAQKIADITAGLDAARLKGQNSLKKAARTLPGRVGGSL